MHRGHLKRRGVGQSLCRDLLQDICISGLDTILWSEIVQVEKHSQVQPWCWYSGYCGYIKIHSIPSTSAWGKLGTLLPSIAAFPRWSRMPSLPPRWAGPPPPAARCPWPAQFQASLPPSLHMGASRPRIPPSRGGKQSPAADNPPQLEPDCLKEGNNYLEPSQCQQLDSTFLRFYFFREWLAGCTWSYVFQRRANT